MAPPKFHTLELAETRPETSDAVVLQFNIPDDLKEAYKFVPGQYLTLRAMIDGEDVRRSYSICSPLSAGNLEVGVKRINGGTFSNFAATLKAGDKIDVMTPEGRFVAPAGGKHNYLLLAAGSGITPMMSIARTTLENEPQSTVTLCYANRSTDTVMFRDALDDLKDTYLTRFRLTHVMDHEAQDIELFNGRLDAEKLSTMVTRGLIDPHTADAVYVCGPQPMIEAATAALVEMGVAEEKIRHELFTPPGGLPVAGDTADEQASGGEAATVHVVVEGATRTFEMEPGERLVKAAARAGIEVPYSCNNGMCATCRCKLTKGDVEMIQNFSLQDWEMDAGFVLACQSQPKSPEVILDFDAL